MQRTTATGTDPFSFSVRCAAFGTTISVTVTGEVDLATIDELAAAISGALSLAPEIVMVDLAQVAFIDCSGVHALVTAHQHSIAAGVELVLMPGPPQVMRLFELCGLLDVLPFSALAQPHALTEATAA
jgi:anti-sigma B factor antagonist